MRAGSNVVDRAPPLQSGGDGGGGGWAWLLTARGVVEAELVRGALEANGIVPVALDSRDPTPGAWLFLSGNPNALVRVFVPASLLDAARLALLDVGFAEPEAPARAPAPAPPHHAWLAVSLTVAVVLIYLAAVLLRSFSS